MRFGLAPASSFFARTIVEAMTIVSTSSVGTAVQAISIPVWPWIGLPSVSSPSRARNATTE